MITGQIDSLGRCLNSAGDVMEPQPTIRFLDMTRIGDRIVLLNGHGQPKTKDQEPCYVEWTPGTIARNSAGIPFDPQPLFPSALVGA